MSILKISNKEIADIVKYSENKVIVVEKKPVFDTNSFKANYFIINLETGEKEAITKNAYLLKKFGSSFIEICEQIASPIQCEAAILSNREVFIIYQNGQCGLFDSNGKMLWNRKLEYNGAPVKGLALDGDYFWCCCESENCVIRYSLDNFKIDLRIGGKDSLTFPCPSFISSDDKSIYVCCNSKQLRAISKENFAVSDIGGYTIGLKRFYRFGNSNIICTTDGAYIDI